MGGGLPDRGFQRNTGTKRPACEKGKICGMEGTEVGEGGTGERKIKKTRV